MLIIPHTACNKLLKQAFHKDRYKDRLRESKICNKIDVAFVRKCEFKMSENLNSLIASKKCGPLRQSD